MLLSLSLTGPQAPELGYLLHKHPAKVQEYPLSFGKATIFYPENTPTKVTCALLVELDTVELVREKSYEGLLDQYVNDRPFVASSFLSTAISQVMGSALNGNCKDRPALVEQELPLTATVAVVKCHAGEGLIRDLFEPLGYEVQVQRHVLDSQQEWGESAYHTVTLSHKVRLMHLLRHLYVLLPVLDNDKHYFVTGSEMEKLLEKGEEWLVQHPRLELITRRFLKHRMDMVETALERLVPLRLEQPEEKPQEQEEKLERALSLHDQRLDTLAARVIALGARSALDLGCGEGKLLRRLMRIKGLQRITGMDVSWRSLEIAKRRLRWEEMSPAQRERMTLLHGALTYRDKRLEGFDVALLSEVIEHLDEPRLHALEKAVFHYARPNAVLVTTPNAEYNVLFESLPAGHFRHADHRFEWTRAQFQEWAGRVATEANYTVSFEPLGTVHELHGGPSQMAIFTKGAAGAERSIAS